MKTAQLLSITLLVAAFAGASIAKAENYGSSASTGASTSDMSATTADTTQHPKLTKKTIQTTRKSIKIEKAQPANVNTMNANPEAKVAPGPEDDSYSGTTSNSSLGRPSVGPGSESESTVSPTNTDINDKTRSPGN